MADVTTASAKWQYTFNFERDGEETTRVFSIDNPLGASAGVSAAKAFRDVFTGAASSPFSVIDPTQFIQPTGWRDEDPDEPPWTTTAVYLKRIDETVTTYDGGETGRNLRLVDTGEGNVDIYYNGANSSVQPAVTAYITNDWADIYPTWTNNHWFVDAPNDATILNVYVPPEGDQWGSAAETIKLT